MEEKKEKELLENQYDQKFIYTQLAKASVAATEPYNIYGVIIDATAPYRQGDTMSGMQRHMVSIKIVDASLNVKSAQIIKDYENKTE